MNKIETPLKDCYVIEPNVIGDSRGWFMESYSKKKFEELDLDYDFIQDNHSFSSQVGILRGIHCQVAPYAQAKLVRCTRGKILDVAVDLRTESPTYKQWFAVELTPENAKQLLVPRGFGHGFVTLSDDCEVQYKTDNFYNFESDRSIQFDDPEIGVMWGIENPMLSEKDSKALPLSKHVLEFE
ncbi:dTDP-4-dehydrorhamnose 3,5-epimerase [Erysipelothrix sp. HDW6C]|uniref:dTDP-4-dehydrorhamnose 3,5-epimerase n=1 Tax=Erysipelothrix sp. HDW6C TaxID=2714930 RepID=UPI00140CEB45|nr:dTDP-4-dehydrorhamnose 3,5-epimerase [Erysipelothrix sp. HDW6C]QIK70033.1 dTDP-4-dehydrorhamnose 3,5-epimerase [Erysipelothrix sp. HDW6C]